MTARVVRIIRPTEVEAREGYRIWLRYLDGSAGEVDLFPSGGARVFRLGVSQGASKRSISRPSEP